MFQIARDLKKPKRRILLFVEGDTEYNYFDHFKTYNDLEIDFKKPINVDGGGYTRFLKEVRKTSMSGYIAFFIVLDLDKYYIDKKSFYELLNYCNRENKKGKPHFIIGTNSDFELFGCCHCPNFNIGKNTKTYIEKVFNFKRLDDFKSHKKTYEFLNSNEKSYEIALEKLSKQNNLIKNNYTTKKKGLDFNIKSPKIELNEDNMVNQHSNMIELFKFIKS